jgi:hypothetical protein
VISLASWLKDRVHSNDVSQFDNLAMTSVSPIDEFDNHPLVAGLRDEIGSLKARINELEMSLTASIDERESERLAFGEREQALMCRLEVENTANFAQLFANALNVRFEQIESLLVQILTPFLAERITTKVTDDLIGLLHQSLRDSTCNILEVRAPLRLHDTIDRSFTELGIHTRMVVSPVIQMIFDTHATQLEDYSKHWLDLLADIQVYDEI